jgi:hypothetical protein
MSILISDDSSVFVYDSVTGLPLNMEVFNDAYEAEAFLEWAVEAAQGDVREYGAAEELRALWNEHFSEQWEKDFYAPINPAECPLCGEASNTGVHSACADREAMLADLTPSFSKQVGAPQEG